MTPRALLRSSAARLRQAGIPDPENDGALLLSSLTGKEPLSLRLDMDTQLTAQQLEAFEQLLQRRLCREPLQYILGEAPFLGRSFQVDSRVLIPRPETELLCEMAAAFLRQQTEQTALDLCCGSGCIAVSLALEVPEARVEAADLSPDALAVSRGNAQRLGAAVTFRQGDLWEAVAGQKYRVIISNPPYIPRKDCSTLQEEVLREPMMALDGGLDGLDFYRRIADGCGEHLLPGGMLLLEVGIDEAQAVAELLRQKGLERIRIHRDYQQIERMVTARMPEVSSEA